MKVIGTDRKSGWKVVEQNVVELIQGYGSGKNGIYDCRESGQMKGWRV